MDEFRDNEAMTISELEMVKRSIGRVQSMILSLGDVDLSRGKAKIKNGRCFWTKDGRRVAVTLLGIGEGNMASISHEVDVNAPPTGKFT